jgi:hypothetical protein
MTDQTAIAMIGSTDLAAAFSSRDKIDALISGIEARVRSHTPDVTTKRGRDEIASLAYAVARSKTALDEAGKALNEDARARIAVVDAERRRIRERLDDLKNEARRPLDEWEATESARVQSLRDRLDRLINAQPHEDASAAIANLIHRVEAVVIGDDWQEMVAAAAKAKDATLARLRSQFVAAAKREEEQAELARLRTEAAEREAYERARREAEEAALRAAAAERAEAERQAAIVREREDAARKAAEQAEARARAEAEQAAREAAEREARLVREVEKARAAAERAAQAERDRIAAAEAEEKAARAKREADQAHRAKIRAEIAEALMPIPRDGIVDALMDGRIPHIRVML